MVEDVRVAADFMYSAADPNMADGVIFKIWGRTSAGIEWCSFVPEERERLFLPNTAFEVLDWYPATEAILQRGVPKDRDKVHDTATCFSLDSESLVEPLPLREVSSLKMLHRQLHQSKVVVIEMRELDVDAAFDRMMSASRQLF